MLLVNFPQTNREEEDTKATLPHPSPVRRPSHAEKADFGRFRFLKPQSFLKAFAGCRDPQGGSAAEPRQSRPVSFFRFPLFFWAKLWYNKSVRTKSMKKGSILWQITERDE